MLTCRLMPQTSFRRYNYILRISGFPYHCLSFAAWSHWHHTVLLRQLLVFNAYIHNIARPSIIVPILHSDCCVQTSLLPHRIHNLALSNASFCPTQFSGKLHMNDELFNMCLNMKSVLPASRQKAHNPMRLPDMVQPFSGVAHFVLSEWPLGAYRHTVPYCFGPDIPLHSDRKRDSTSPSPDSGTSISRLTGVGDGYFPPP